jgi:hypothetical protein
MKSRSYDGLGIGETRNAYKILENGRLEDPESDRIVTLRCILVE